ncbi:sodium/proline symporter [Alkalihalobacterium alkalinitrilicum]|uniref:sodium/proline symporter n=1 Tax=Alkalihalobacterium alkalinitrilicum TaxID=427920 RepID=UPI0009956884|nr:sodium/proline symporter [Alkalihalobacterium alkalinitrilicum]
MGYVFWAIVSMIIYTIILSVIGWVATKNTKSVEDYLVAGKSLNIWLLTFGLMAAILSGGAVMGYSGTGFGAGYAGYVMLVSCAFPGIVISYWILAKPMRIVAEKHAVYTLPDFLALRYNNNKGVRGLSAFAILIGCLAYLIAQFAAMGWVLSSILNISYTTSIFISAVLLSLYTIGGGMKASMWTNFFQMIMLVIIGVLLNILILPEVGGLSGLHGTLAETAPSFLLPWHDSGSFAMAIVLQYGLIVGLLAYAGVPHVSTKFLTVKSIKVLKWAPLVSVILYFLGVLSQWPGMAGKVLVDQGVLTAPEAADQILPHLIYNFFNSPILAGIFLVAVAAAVMSTAESFLILSSAAIVRDFSKNTLGKAMTEKVELKWIRICSVFVLIVGCLLSLNPPGFILLVVSVAWGAFAAMFAPALYLGIRWRRATPQGAIAGLLTGIAVGGIIGILNLTVFSSDPLLAGFNVAAVGTVLSTIMLVVVSLLTKPVDSPIFDHFTNKSSYTVNNDRTPNIPGN